MTDEPLISVVLPTFNGERYLEQAAASCLNQTYRNLELIIVDDASTDNTPEIIARLAASDSRIVVIRHAENRKLPASLNTGFAKARGEYLTWTSDDNYYHPAALRTLAEILRKKPEVDIVYSDYLLIDDLNKEIGKVFVSPAEGLGFKGNCIGACFLFRREVFAQLGGYDEKYYLAEDYDFWLRAARRFSLAPVHRFLYYYRFHAQSLTNLKTERINDVTEHVARRHLAALSGSAPDRIRQAGLYVQLARIEHHRSNTRRARLFLSIAFHLAPAAVWRNRDPTFLAIQLCGPQTFWKVFTIYQHIKKRLGLPYILPEHSQAL
jgi:GT2 family glycosyltransferase